MSWYYALGGQQQGPVDDAQFELLIQSGQITAADLVWKEGMANWQPLSTVRPDVAFTGPAASLPAPSGAPPVVGGLNPDEITCVECRGRFTRDNAIQYGSAWVCASCKPVFVQKLKEGALTAGGVGAAGAAAFNFAGFWVRLAAKLIDGVVMIIVLLIPMVLVGILVFGTASRSNQTSPGFILFQIVANLLSIVLPMIYSTFFNGKYGATPGKMALGLKIITAEGTPITMLRAFGRFWAEQLSGMTCTIGYIIAAFDAEKRSLHDHICSTRVIYK